MAPHCFEIEDDKALLGLGAGEELGVPILPNEALILGPCSRSYRDKERKHHPEAQAHDLSPWPIDVDLATEGARE
jgi:hypothetical protein